MLKSVARAGKVGMNSSRTLWWFLSVCVDGLAGLTQKPERQHVGAEKPNCSVAGAVQNPPVEARDNGEQNISMGREEGAICPRQTETAGLRGRD